ncbi:MAG: O-acetylhomoserine aminocarboxypropyltransferase/cysteine synthase family protein [Micrococcaceae bacterium]
MTGSGTHAVRAGSEAAHGHRPVAVPIHQTAAYEFDSWEQAREVFALRQTGDVYSRTGNPTQLVLEQRLAALDDGVAALATGSGQSAVVVALLALARAGEHLVASSTLYGGTMDLLTDTFTDFGIESTLVDPLDLEAWAAAIRPTTRALFVESVGNPTASIPDLESLAEIAHRAGVPLVVDNTVATAALLKPKDHGADIVVYSATKHLGGHGGSLAGAIVDLGTFDFGADPERWPQFTQPYPRVGDVVLWERFGRESSALLVYARTKLVHDLGPSLSPFNARDILLGIETLEVRLARISTTTQTVVDALLEHPAVTRVHHPLAERGAARDRAEHYLPRGWPGVLSFDVVDPALVPAVVDGLRLFTLAANIGDVRSLVIHPATTTHSHFTDAQLTQGGFSAATIRLSVGLENPEDLVADLSSTLDAASTAVPAAHQNISRQKVGQP